jgi:hypothetical protein
MTNQKIISRLRNVTQPRGYFRTVHKSLDNAYFYRHVSWVFIGEVEGGESVAEMADFILSCERITWSLALGYTKEKLFLSLRAARPKARCAFIIRKLITNFPGAVGGHNQFAGGFINLDGGIDPSELADTIIKRFIRLILKLPKSIGIPEGTPLVEV